MSQSSLLTKSTREILEHWRRLEPHWRDARAAGFHDLYLNDLADTAKIAEGLMDELSKLLTRIRQDCE